MVLVHTTHQFTSGLGSVISQYIASLPQDRDMYRYRQIPANTHLVVIIMMKKLCDL